MLNYSEIFLYATIYSNFKFIDFFELSCLHTHTHADEYFIVAVDIVPMTTADLVLSHTKCPRARPPGTKLWVPGSRKVNNMCAAANQANIRKKSGVLQNILPCVKGSKIMPYVQGQKVIFCSLSTVLCRVFQ